MKNGTIMICKNVPLLPAREGCLFAGRNVVRSIISGIYFANVSGCYVRTGVAVERNSSQQRMEAEVEQLLPRRKGLSVRMCLAARIRPLYPDENTPPFGYAF